MSQVRIFFTGLIGIWKDFFTKHNIWAIAGICLIALYQIVDTFKAPNYGWLLGIVVACGYLMFLPAAVFLIDLDARKNPNRPRTIGNFFRILIGR